MKRALDIFVAILGLLVLAPFLVLILAIVRLSTRGRPLFLHKRVGRHGRDFFVYKFRTMRSRPGAESGAFDPGASSRVTPIGAFLRRAKLDELPQLWNVLKGEMSLVGPRPEVRQWVNAYPERWATVLTVRPGITNRASIVYRNEEELLASSPNPERTYRDVILPHKLDLYEEYVRTRSFWGDVVILFSTLGAVVQGRRQVTVDREEGKVSSS